MNQEFKKVIKSKEWMNQVSETVVSHHANTAYTCNLLLWNASARRERPMWGSSQLTHYSYLYALGCHLQEGCNESHTPGALNAAHEHLQSGENSLPQSRRYKKTTHQSNGKKWSGQKPCWLWKFYSTTRPGSVSEHLFCPHMLGRVPGLSDSIACGV